MSKKTLKPKKSTTRKVKNQLEVEDINPEEITSFVEKILQSDPIQRRDVKRNRQINLTT